MTTFFAVDGVDMWRVGDYVYRNDQSTSIAGDEIPVLSCCLDCSVLRREPDRYLAAIGDYQVVAVWEQYWYCSALYPQGWWCGTSPVGDKVANRLTQAAKILSYDPPMYPVLDAG